LSRTIIYLFFLFFVFLIPLYLTAQTESSVSKKNAMMVKMLNDNHYKPRQPDDELYEQIFQRFIRTMDPYCLFFTGEDIKSLKKQKFTLDNAINNDLYAFIEKFSEIYKNRLILADTIISVILDTPFDYTKKEYLSFSDSSFINAPSDEFDLADHWRRWLKYRNLQKLFTYAYNDSVSGADNFDNLLQKEPEIRKEVADKEKQRIRYLINNNEVLNERISYHFLNTVATCYDPHTMYFSFSDKQSLEESLSREGYSFGIHIEENENGDICISRLVPGGPAWKSNELHKGDILMSIEWQDGDTIDLTGYDLYELTDILETRTSRRIVLTVRKANGRKKSVKLVKEKIRQDENIVKSFILKGEKNVGYISLPGFYTEWENQKALGCANDMGKEIIKLKREGIEGLIIDLRYNGGGSMMEAFDLAGIFIDEGPLCILRNRKKKLMTFKDRNRGTIYNGPLIVLVNGLSASASEILAAALQDYNRAVIVGSHTYGKATGQVVLPLDTLVNSDNYYFTSSETKEGYVKITTEKLYRITCKTHQLSGVTPDIELPYIQDTYGYREASSPFAFTSDTISKKVYYTPLKELPVSTLAGMSKNRLDSDDRFREIKQLNDSLSDIIAAGEHRVPLDLETYMKEEINGYRIWEKLEEKTTKRSNDYEVINNEYDREIMQIDEYGKEINDILKNKIREDIYIEEAYRILFDFINFDISH